MAGPGFLSKRLLLAITQSPSVRANSLHCPDQLPSPQVWVRTITSSSRRQNSHRPLVSFGKENDDVIAPYLEKNNTDSKFRKRRTTATSQSDASVEYEIGQFVDRSQPTTQRVVISPEDDASSSEAATLTREISIRPPNKIRQNGDVRTDSRADWGSKARERISLRFAGDTFPTESRTRRTRNLTGRADTHAPTSSKPPLVRKVTEDADKWAIQKNALKEKFQDGWQPRKKLSPDAQEGIRGLHEQDPITYSTEVLAKQFKQSPEAIRRILKSKWLSKQSPEKLQERRERWAKRHDRIWDAKAEIGQRPPRRKDKEVEDPDKFEQDLEKRRILGEI